MSVRVRIQAAPQKQGCGQCAWRKALTRVESLSTRKKEVAWAQQARGLLARRLRKGEERVCADTPDLT